MKLKCPDCGKYLQEYYARYNPNSLFTEHKFRCDDCIIFITVEKKTVTLDDWLEEDGE